MKLSSIPNLLTGLRILLVVPILASLFEDRFDIALLLFFISGWTDALDGYLAKRFNWQSRLGAILDPVADKILLVSCIVVLGWIQLLPSWFVLAVLLRDIVILFGSAAYHYFIGRIEIAPLMISKYNTVLLLGVVFFSVVEHAYEILPVWLVPVFIYATFVTTVVSGAAYLIVWGRKAWRETSKLKSS